MHQPMPTAATFAAFYSFPSQTGLFATEQWPKFAEAV